MKTIQIRGARTHNLKNVDLTIPRDQFIVLPVFSLYAQQLPGATPLLIGIAVGIYGLTQGLLQIPFGIGSDRIGRKPIILLGLIIFCLGSLIAALSHSIIGIIIGRTLQGAGAVGSATIALVADLTRDNQRTKAMALVGISIGFAFASAMLLGPLLSQWIGVPGLFALTAILGVLAIFLLSAVVPNPPPLTLHHSQALGSFRAFLSLLTNKQLAPLYWGIFILHAILTSSFIVIPISLQTVRHLTASKQWTLFIPALIFASIISLALLRKIGSRTPGQWLMIGAIVILGFSELLFQHTLEMNLGPAISLFLFFSAFTLLEACLPAFISLAAPAASRGAAMGIFSSSQFLGIFVGGLVGGWLYGVAGIDSIYSACTGLCVLWLLLILVSSKRH